MNESYVYRVISFAKPIEQQTIVFEGPIHNFAQTLKSLVGSCKVTAVTHTQHQPSLPVAVDPITTVVPLYRDPTQMIPSLVRRLYSKPGAGLILGIGDSNLTGLPALKRTLSIWNTYLAVGGRIFIEMHRVNPVHYNDLIKQYRTVAHQAGFEITHINGLEMSKTFGTTIFDIRVLIISTRQMAREVANVNKGQSELLLQTADAWEDRLNTLLKSTMDAEEVAAHLVDRLLLGQNRRIFATLRPHHADKVYDSLY
ncbi:hypothetical protein KCV07_g3771, partial [Aureobasidium melanogenum]